MTTSHPGEESSLKVATTIGGLAQLGERLAGSQKVIGSSPLSSTIGNKKPFGEYVEGLSYCGHKSYVIE
jgi:hypothetical protein